MAQQTNKPAPTPKRPDWNEASVREAALLMARSAGLPPHEVEAFANNTVHFWKLGNATAVTHNWPK